jgi:FtsZ-binding cell division protein ZapB
MMKPEPEIGDIGEWRIAARLLGERIDVLNAENGRLQDEHVKLRRLNEQLADANVQLQNQNDLLRVKIAAVKALGEALREAGGLQ